MQRNLLIGAIVMAIVGIVASDYLINRIGAQDASGEKKNDLDEALKRALESKKDGLPSLPTLPPIIVNEKPALANTPKKDLPLPLPPISEPKKDTIPAPAPLPSIGESKKDTLPPPLPPINEPKKNAGPPVIPPLDVKDGPAPQPKESVLPRSQPFPPLSAQPKDEVAPPANTKPMLPPSGGTSSGGLTPPPLDTQKPTPRVGPAPMLPVAEELAKLKNCPWSLKIDIVDGQTIVVATVQKKHEFKIVCQSLDLQTGKGTLHAIGKVQITDDTMTGMCEQLSIPLMDDRLVLEGGAAITIEKDASRTSDSAPVAFELKGDRLTLQISQLPTKVVHASPRAAIDENVKQASAKSAATTDKQWTSYGTLRRAGNRMTSSDEAVWTLIDARGNVISHLVARNGGSLAQYEGRRISVYGVSEQIGNDSYLRVSHIALP